MSQRLAGSTAWQGVPQTDLPEGFDPGQLYTCDQLIDLFEYTFVDWSGM